MHEVNHVHCHLYCKNKMQNALALSMHIICGSSASFITLLASHFVQSFAAPDRYIKFSLVFNFIILHTWRKWYSAHFPLALAQHSVRCKSPSLRLFLLRPDATGLCYAADCEEFRKAIFWAAPDAIVINGCVRATAFHVRIAAISHDFFAAAKDNRILQCYVRAREPKRYIN